MSQKSILLLIAFLSLSNLSIGQKINLNILITEIFYSNNKMDSSYLETEFHLIKNDSSKFINYSVPKLNQSYFKVFIYENFDEIQRQSKNKDLFYLSITEYNYESNENLIKITFHTSILPKSGFFRIRKTLIHQDFYQIYLNYNIQSDNWEINKIEYPRRNKL